MIGIFPLSDKVRERIKRQQADDEAGGWDSCEPPPLAEIVRLDLFQNRQNRKAEGLEPASLDSARNEGCGLLVPSSAHHDLLDAVSLLSFDALNVERRGDDGNKDEGAESAG